MNSSAPSVVFTIEQLGNPLLSSAAMEDYPMLEEKYRKEEESNDSFVGGIVEDVDIDYALPDGIDLSLNEEDDTTTLSSPTRNPDPELVNDVLSIHSYSQPSGCNPDEAIITAKPTKEVIVKKTIIQSEQPKKAPKRTRKPVKRFDDSSDDSEEEFEELKSNKRSRMRSNSSVSVQNKKVKLYEMAPFDDPEMERCRQNAINAKVNRDRKKKEKNAMQSEMNKLKQENQQLRSKNRRYRARLSGFEARLQALEAIIRTNRLDGLLKASGNANENEEASNNSSLESSSSDIDNNDEAHVIYYG